MSAATARPPVFLTVLLSLMFCTPLAHASELNQGNSGWMLTATALVLFMTIPGLALFYGGLEIGRASCRERV